MKPITDKLYKNKKWLRGKYIIEQSSHKIIATKTNYSLVIAWWARRLLLN